MRNGIKKFFRIGLLGIFSCLFLSGNVRAVSYLDLGEEGTPSQGYQPENYNIILEDNGEYKLEKNGETKNLMYGYVSVRGRPFLYYFGYYNDRLGIFQFMDDNPSYNQSTTNRIWYNATIYNYTTQSGKFINGQTLPSANACNSNKPDNDTWQCYFKLRDDFGEEYNEKIDGMIRRNNNGGYLPCFIYEELNEIVCMDQRTTNSNNYANYDNTNRYNFETFNNTMGIYPTFIAKEEQTTPQTNYACPTIQQLINTYPNQYNTGLCYSSSLIFSGGTIQQVEPKDIFTLYPLYTGFVADINLYNNYCVGPNTQTACETAFDGKTEQYTLISKIPDNVKKANLYAYCNLQLNYEDKNASTCVTSGAINTGEYIPPITNQGVIDELIDGDYNIVLPASGYVMDTLKDENGERKIDWNIIESIQNLYSKFTTIFTGREGNNGIIPEYITRMILVIILFAFFKK